ncbi:MAG: cytochrome c oxidase subunit II [Gemmatimonadota bacterium]
MLRQPRPSREIGSKRPSGAAGWCAALLGVLLVAACGGEAAYPQSTIHPQSDFAEAIHSLYVSIFWWTMLILAVVWTVLAYVLVKFRGKEGDPKPRQIRGHMGLEIGWTIGPALIVMAIVVPTIQAVFATQRPLSDDALIVHVTGHRFWWQFEYPEQGVSTANELRLPLGRPVSLRLEARDVVHSFWIPALGGKRDLAPEPALREGEGEPGYTWIHFTPTVAGTYLGQCAEFCGESHAFMGLRAVVAAEADFQAWLERWLAGAVTASDAETPAPPDSAGLAVTQVAPQAPAPPPAQPPLPVAAQEDPLVAAGRTAFLTQSTCVACHAINGTTAQGRVGPNLTLFGARGSIGAGRLPNTPENLARWIRDPQSVKPGAEMPGTQAMMQIPRGRDQMYSWPATGLSEEQVTAVAAFLSSLR